MEELGRWYNMNVVFGNEEAKGYEMHFLCERNGDIDQTIKLINIMGKVRAERHGNTLYSLAELIQCVFNSSDGLSVHIIDIL